MEIYVVKTSIYKTITKAYAYEKAKTKYSQPKRMKKGYADCSSYVWKCYKTAGIYFGDKSYAPTAANIAKWCTNNKRALKLSTYNGKSTKLKPGDLIFYKKRIGKNGRYKNIEHVSMYIGNDTILHASGKMVSFGYPWYRKVAAIGRPVK
jgi:cell wall-associated NlpC family hydrolase